MECIVTETIWTKKRMRQTLSKSTLSSKCDPKCIPLAWQSQEQHPQYALLKFFMHALKVLRTFWWKIVAQSVLTAKMRCFSRNWNLSKYSADFCTNRQSWIKRLKAITGFSNRGLSKKSNGKALLMLSVQGFHKSGATFWTPCIVSDVYWNVLSWLAICLSVLARCPFILILCSFSRFFFIHVIFSPDTLRQTTDIHTRTHRRSLQHSKGPNSNKGAATLEKIPKEKLWNKSVKGKILFQMIMKKEKRWIKKKNWLID